MIAAALGRKIISAAAARRLTDRVGGENS